MSFKCWREDHKVLIRVGVVALFALQLYLMWPVDLAPACRAAAANDAAVICVSPMPRILLWLS